MGEQIDNVDESSQGKTIKRQKSSMLTELGSFWQTQTHFEEPRNLSFFKIQNVRDMYVLFQL